MRGLRPLVALAIAGVMILPGAANAAPTVSIAGVTVNGNSATVTGNAVFEPITAAQSVVTEESTFVAGTTTNTPVGEAAGLKLTDATITPITGGLRFTWHVASLPEQTPPEGVRYNWAFKIGSKLYQLQAKRTNLLSLTTAENPVGHVQQAAAQKNFFQLRGACVDAYEGAPANGCYHLAFLNGSFDVPNKRVSIDLPFETRDSIGRLVAPDFKPGAVLEDNGGTSTGGSVISAGFQAVLSFNAYMANSINGIAKYYVGPSVALGVAAPGQDPSTITYSAPAALTGSTFTGNVSGLTSSKNTVYVRACNGTECSYSSLKAL